MPPFEASCRPRSCPSGVDAFTGTLFRPAHRAGPVQGMGTSSRFARDEVITDDRAGCDRRSDAHRLATGFAMSRASVRRAANAWLAATRFELGRLSADRPAARWLVRGCALTASWLTGDTRRAMRATVTAAVAAVLLVAATALAGAAGMRRVPGNSTRRSPETGRSRRTSSATPRPLAVVVVMRSGEIVTGIQRFPASATSTPHVRARPLPRRRLARRRGRPAASLRREPSRASRRQAARARGHASTASRSCAWHPTAHPTPGSAPGAWR